MKFVEIISKKKIILISILLFLYVILNLLDGDRGLISFFEKKKMIQKLTIEKNVLISKLNIIERQNSLLTDIIDTDYLETLYRKRFMVGKKEEKIYIK